MRYMGSKYRLSKDILKFIEPYYNDKVNYYEPFVGGANMIDKIPKNVFKNIIGNDFNKYLIALLIQMRDKPETLIYKFIEKEDWLNNYLKPFKENGEIIINNKKIEDYNIGLLGVTKTYNSMFMHQYRGILNNRNHQLESHNNIIKQCDKLNNITFIYGDYKDIIIENNSVVYCDPPYLNTTKYEVDIFHEEFYEWCRDLVNNKNCIVFVSEYNNLEKYGFKFIYEKQLKGKKSVEKLFILKKDLK